MEGAAAAADREQLDRVIRGDSSALRAIYDRCSGRAFAIALKVLGTRPDAEEVLQETFLEIWKRAREYDPRRGGIEGWVVTIARSRSIDRLRARGAAAAHLSNVSAANPISDAAPPLEAAEQRQNRERIHAALQSLPAEQRTVLELAYFEGLSQREIAERTGDPLGTVKTRVRLGMEKMALMLGEREGLS